MERRQFLKEVCPPQGLGPGEAQAQNGRHTGKFPAGAGCFFTEGELAVSQGGNPPFFYRKGSRSKGRFLQ